MHRFKTENFIDGFREMREDDISKVCVMLNAHLNEYKVHINFSEDEVKHFLLP
jgi:hypothetical protein